MNVVMPYGKILARRNLDVEIYFVSVRTRAEHLVRHVDSLELNFLDVPQNSIEIIHSKPVFSKFEALDGGRGLKAKEFNVDVIGVPEV